MDMQASLLAMALRLEAYARAGVKVREALREIQTVEGGEEKATKPAVLHDLTSLSPKEREIYSLIGQGLEPREIAEKLGKSLKTIEAQRDTIRKKLGFATSHDLTRSAREKTPMS